MIAGGHLRAEQAGERGFSLVEVVIAIGVLAGVLLSICSMFIMGARQVKGGKTMTEATALAHDIMETFDRLSFSSLYTTFGAIDTSTTVSISTSSGSNAITPWQAEVTRKLASGVATARLDPVGGTNFGNALGIKMTVTVTWNEVGRAQTVTLSTIRF